MELNTQQREALIETLRASLPQLVAHAGNVRRLLEVGAPASGIIDSATSAVLGSMGPVPDLSPKQRAQWEALIPIIADHAAKLVVVPQPSAAEPEPLLTKQEAARRLGMSERSLQRIMDRNRIRFIKRGRAHSASVRFRSEDIEAYAAAHTVALRTSGRGRPPGC